MELTGIIDLLLSKGVSFAAYRLPNEQKVCFIVQNDNTVKEIEFDALDNVKGFVAAPFLSYRTRKFYFISPDIVFCSGEFAAVKKELENINKHHIEFNVKNTETEKKSYLKQAKKIISRIRSGEVKKVVLSRYFSVAFDKKQTSAFFYGLAADYPDAFVYLLYIPKAGLWTGASPETLLTKKGNRFETMALAGTQLYSENLKWGDKETEEQQYVVDFVEDVLKSINVSGYEKSQPDTIRAGKLAHLRTVFKIDTEALKEKAGITAALLHPTPAVGGLPQKEACNVIQETENHNRRLYTGFLGPWNLNENSWLFVNLRCAEIHDDAIGLYVGGGLTAGSEPEKEWQETVNKSKTMLSVVKKLRTFAP